MTADRGFAADGLEEALGTIVGAYADALVSEDETERANAEFELRFDLSMFMGEMKRVLYIDEGPLLWRVWRQANEVCLRIPDSPEAAAWLRMLEFVRGEVEARYGISDVEAFLRDAQP